jgi:thiol-disulfide isomerase/thioredoxin
MAISGSRRIRVGLLALLLAAAVAACAPAGGENPEPRPAIVDGDIVLDNVHGGTVRWSDYDGKIRIVNFWATWCQPCAVEIPRFNEIAEEYRDRGVQIIGISLDDHVDFVRDFEREIPLDYPSLMNSPALQERYGDIFGVPFTLVLDRSGEPFNSHIGFTHQKWFREDLDALLQQEAP